jgi:hypothetical protein
LKEKTEMTNPTLDSKLNERLARDSQIRLSVIARNLGRAISIPFQFFSPMTASLFDKGVARYWQGCRSIG